MARAVREPECVYLVGASVNSEREQGDNGVEVVMSASLSFKTDGEEVPGIAGESIGMAQLRRDLDVHRDRLPSSTPARSCAKTPDRLEVMIGPSARIIDIFD